MESYAIMLSIAQCSTASNSLYENIRFRPEIRDKVKFAPNRSEVCNFWIEFIRPEGCVHGIYGLSIAYPPRCDW